MCQTRENISQIITNPNIMHVLSTRINYNYTLSVYIIYIIILIL